MSASGMVHILPEPTPSPVVVDGVLNRWACPRCGKLVSKYAFKRHVKGCAEPLPLELAGEHSLPTWPLGSALCFSGAEHG